MGGGPGGSCPVLLRHTAGPPARQPRRTHICWPLVRCAPRATPTSQLLPPLPLLPRRWLSAPSPTTWSTSSPTQSTPRRLTMQVGARVHAGGLGWTTVPGGGGDRGHGGVFGWWQFLHGGVKSTRHGSRWLGWSVVCAPRLPHPRPEAPRRLTLRVCRRGDGGQPLVGVACVRPVVGLLGEGLTRGAACHPLSPAMHAVMTGVPASSPPHPPPTPP